MKLGADLVESSNLRTIFQEKFKIEIKFLIKDNLQSWSLIQIFVFEKTRPFFFLGGGGGESFYVLNLVKPKRNNLN